MLSGVSSIYIVEGYNITKFMHKLIYFYFILFFFKKKILIRVIYK